MEFTCIKNNQWPEIKKIYLEAFPRQNENHICPSGILSKKEKPFL